MATGNPLPGFRIRILGSWNPWNPNPQVPESAESESGQPGIHGIRICGARNPRRCERCAYYSVHKLKKTSQSSSPSSTTRLRRRLSCSAFFSASLSSISVHNFDQSLDRLKGLGGFIGAYIIDLNNKRILASRGNAKSRWDISIPDQCTFFNKKRNVLKRLGECGSLEEITVTSEVTFQMYRNSSQYPHILFFLLLERASTNLAYARLVLLETEKQLVLAAH